MTEPVSPGRAAGASPDILQDGPPGGPPNGLPPGPPRPPTPPEPPRPAKRRRWLRATLWSFAGIVVLAAAVAGGTIAWLLPQLPSLEKVTEYRPREPLQIYSRDGVEIAQFGAEKRQYVPIALIPKLMQDALLAVEDARFREHDGIDPIGLARAVFANLTGGMRQGASTITQQVARNFFLSSRRTLERKMKEALLALQIERQLSKDQILELYMNQIYLGQRAYGFAAASQVYFGKPLGALSVAEVAMLAGLPQNPSYANPVSNLDRARERQAVVLARMRVTGVISDEQFAAAKAEPIRLRSPLQVTLHAEHVAEMARRMVYDRFGEEAYSRGIKVYTSLVSADQEAAYQAVRRGVLAYDKRQTWRGPEDFEEMNDQMPDDEQAAQLLKEHRDDEELRVAIVTRTSQNAVTAQLATGETVRLAGDGLRWALPGLASKAPPALQLRRGAVIRVVKVIKPVPAPKAAKPQRGKPAEPPPPAPPPEESWAISQWPEVEAALVSLDPATGRVRALVGGFDFTQQPFNHVTQAWRQPGSSFKPFLYSAALEQGVMPATVINDAPLLTPEGDAPPNWNPQNSDGVFDGPLTMRQALAKSKNLVSIRILRKIGVPPVRDWAAHFGFEPDKQPDNLTLALGAGSTSPLQLASAYAVLANGGYRVQPVTIERITDAHGVALYEAPPPQPLAHAERALPERNAFVIRSLLQEVTRSGTAARAQATLKRPDIYGKTGTTNDAVDAWFAGFQPSVVAVVWMGYDNPRSLGSRESGGGVSLPIWTDYMGKVLKGVPVRSEVPPPGVVQVNDDWVYSELAEGGYVQSIDLDEDPAALAAAAAASAASMPPNGAPSASPSATPATAAGVQNGPQNGLPVGVPIPPSPMAPEPGASR